MKTKLSILLLICTTLLISLNGFGQKGVSGLVPSHIPDSLWWQCGDAADAYLESRTLKLVGGTTWDYWIKPRPWDHLMYNDIDSVFFDVETIEQGIFTPQQFPEYEQFEAEGHTVRVPSPRYAETGDRVSWIGYHNFCVASDLKKIKIRGTLTLAGSYAYICNPMLELLELPASVTNLDLWFLADCAKFKHLIMRSPQCPATGECSFGTPCSWPDFNHKNFNPKDVTVWVPEGSADSYKQGFNEKFGIQLDITDTRWMTDFSLNYKAGMVDDISPGWYLTSFKAEPANANTWPLIEWLDYDHYLVSPHDNNTIHFRLYSNMRLILRDGYD